MRILVTGSSGHLGEALVRVLRAAGEDVVGLDLLPAPTTDLVGSAADEALAARAVRGAEAVLHTATLHKPHVGSHPKRAFVETNVAGTLALLEASVSAGVGAFVMTSSTTAFGRALSPGPGAPAAWVDEDVRPRVRNVYGATKVAAEDLCELVAAEHGLPCVVLRTARFFPEDDDRDEARARFDPLELKVAELLHRRVDLADVVDVHRLAAERAAAIGFGRYVVSATTPFTRGDLVALRGGAPAVVERRVPGATAVLAARSWRVPDDIDRVYDNARARAELGWRPRHDFATAIEALRTGEDPRSALARSIGAKGYHAESTGVYTSRS